MAEEEMLIVVDEQDNIIRHATRHECHEKKLLHRIIEVLVFKDNTYKEVLIQKRSSTKKVEHNMFALTEGHVGKGETYSLAARREVAEELFCEKELPSDVEIEELFKISKLEGDPTFMQVFRIIHPGPFNIDLVEVGEVFFQDINKVIKNITESPDEYTHSCRYVLEEYQNKFMN
ncbi:NUDIX domain-containing protein [Candidatus Woesearchaeota archaeon]|mgnify:CR=1 FL=1|jgi:isopentenyldiphosphate isomerase|nr:NUDIX domain-containing protein [Candidatus Woesearchaeota archaeon]